MSRLPALFFLCLAALALPAVAIGVDMDYYEPRVGGEPVPPAAAIISPGGAHLEVTQQVRTRVYNGRTFLTFTLPPGASNLQLSVPGHTINRWSTTPTLLNDDLPTVGRRAKIEKERVKIMAMLMTVNARIALWQAPPQNGSAQDMTQLQGALAQEMPKLVLEQSGLQLRLKLIDEELSRMPHVSGIGEEVRVILADDLPEGQPVEVRYSYQHDSCGWEAIYDFDARPDEGSGDVINVRMLAEVWQFTGMDWKDTKITLATKGFGPREPQPLPEWIVDSQQTPRPQARAMSRNLKAAPMAIAGDADADMPAAMAAVTASTDSVYASWSLMETGLPQGRSRLQITSAAWKAPLQWLARPGRNSSPVWLYAKYHLPADQAWPAGQAQYNVDGQSVGNGDFRPRSGEATLYFGADPRVTVITTNDAQKRGESGIINTSKNWTWSWTYTIANQHNKAVKVRVERPAPMIVDQDVTVAYNDNPKAVLDSKKHMLVWDVNVPAHGKSDIQHSITISSPTRLPLLPDIP